MKRASLLCLAGPTGSGKSAAAMAVAAALGRSGRVVEIVSVDSAQVYRGMDIGTAKPSPHDRAQVAHHLVDIADPSDRYSAARFVADARTAIAAIRDRGAVPLLVGGTMLYLKALREGLAPMPAADAALRAAIDAEAGRRGWPALHTELAAVDPVAAARIAPNDSQRIQRALEVFRSSGRTISEWHATPVNPSEAKGLGLADDEILRFAQYDEGAEETVLISLEPRERSWLHERIAARFADMLDAGFVDEVRALRARGDLDPSLPSMRAVGYRQAWQALDADDVSMLQAAGEAATRRLAKRQLTWLRSIADRRVVACDDAGATDAVVALAMRALPA